MESKRLAVKEMDLRLGETLSEIHNGESDGSANIDSHYSNEALCPKIKINAFLYVLKLKNYTAPAFREINRITLRASSRVAPRLCRNTNSSKVLKRDN